MNRMILNILILTVAMTWLCMTAGCEEKVVSRRITTTTGVPGAADYRYVKARPIRTQEKGMLAGMGDFLFGWTDDLFKDNPTSSGRTTQNAQPTPTTTTSTPKATTTTTTSPDQWKAGQWQTVTPKQ